MKTKKREAVPEKPRYQPTERERVALAKQIDRIKAEAPARRMKVLADRGDAVPRLSFNHPDEEVGYGLLCEAIGTANADFLNGLLHQLANVSSSGRAIDESELNFMLSVIKGIKPNDQLEAMLAAQMAAVHMATMTFARRLNHVETIPQQDSAERALNKLARTYTSQMEALKRYRAGGEQKVTVQHVSVSEGGQAIVGNVTQAAQEKKSDQAVNTPPALTDARQPAMPIIDQPKREPVSVRSRKEDEGQSST